MLAPPSRDRVPLVISDSGCRIPGPRRRSFNHWRMSLTPRWPYGAPLLVAAHREALCGITRHLNGPPKLQPSWGQPVASGRAPRLSPQPHVVCPQAPCPDGAHAEHLTDKQPWGSVKGKPKREQEPKPVPGAQGPRQAASATQGPNLPCPLSPDAGASHQTEGQPTAC